MTALQLVVRVVFVLLLAACGGGSMDLEPEAKQPRGTMSRLSATVGSGTSQLDQTPTGFFYPIGRANFSTGRGWWMSKDPDYFTDEYHIGVDMMTNSLDAQAYAIADGKVVYISVDKTVDGSMWGPGNCAPVIEHKTYDGKVFSAVYGHLQCSTIPAKNSDVYAGKPIGKTGPWSGGIHLHFGIHDGPFNGENQMARSGWGRLPVSRWPDTNTFTDPVDFIETRRAYNPSTEVQARCQGNICWAPATNSCEGASSRYRLGSNMFAQSTGLDSCAEVQATLFSISDGPNPQERVPEDPLWQRFWRAIRNVFGETVSAADIRDFGTLNTISVLTGNVVAGNVTKAVHGTGQGYLAQPTEPPTLNPPDFVVKKVWLQTPWGTETYKFGLGENFDTKAQAGNIGDGSCPTQTGEPTTITGHFYLSKGYKEDVHSGDGAWHRIDSTTTQCSSLLPGDTHTETKNTVISQWITTPGIYNIVYCIDHPLDDHNNGGEHAEKHESNNCSTEAVFEVTANQVENVPDVDFTVSGFTVLRAPVYAGDYIRLGAWITNSGTANATADIRSSYTVSCNGGPTSVLTDDGTMASTLTAGANVWEEIQTPVLMPNVAGICTLTFTADYLGNQTETDETNNGTSLTVTLAPRPAPVLSITRFEDKVGCCTTNTGAAPKPRIWVYNGGTVAPGANVTVVYQVSSPVATGGLYQVIGYGTIEPRELPPGTSDEDQMDCDGCWRIPTSSAWKKQWHNFRACLRTDGGTPVPSTGAPSPGEVCAVYQRYSKS
ncbi:MAG: peptidoglycan DD-metalloendopeptidase family protein [Candidatus Moraniibacteriota bacterium]